MTGSGISRSRNCIAKRDSVLAPSAEAQITVRECNTRGMKKYFGGWRGGSSGRLWRAAAAEGWGAKRYDKKSGRVFEVGSCGAVAVGSGECGNSHRDEWAIWVSSGRTADAG